MNNLQQFIDDGILGYQLRARATFDPLAISRSLDCASKSS
jgi:hypothetical protein